MRTICKDKGQEELERTACRAYLLPKTYPRSRVEGEEYKRIWRQIFVEPLVDEAIRVKFERYE